MIVVDSSCLLAILQNEPENRAFEEALAGDERYVMSACAGVTALPEWRGFELFTAADIEIMAFDELQMRAAAVAFERY